VKVSLLRMDLVVQAYRGADRQQLGRVRDARIQARLSQAHRERGDRDPGSLQDREALAKAASPVAEQGVLGNPTSLEREPVGVAGTPTELAVRRLDREAGRARRNEEGRDSALAVS